MLLFWFIGHSWDHDHGLSAPMNTCHLQSCTKVGKSKCSRCKGAFYCSEICQRVDWKTHKKHCKKFQEEDQEEEQDEQEQHQKQKQQQQPLSSKECSRDGCQNRGRHKCGDCRKTRYCSKDCQKEDWINHKKNCKIVTVSSKHGVTSSENQNGPCFRKHASSEMMKFITPILYCTGHPR